jgi:2-dehydropantoate 2-reductase
MKILFFGRGVESTQYAWALEKAGNQVEFYVRPGRIAEYGTSVKLDILDGRKSSKGTPVKEAWQIAMREEIDTNHDYDLIIVSVNHRQFSSAANILAPVIGKATVLVWGNMWQDPEAAVSMLPPKQIVWGFPGGGGGFIGNTLKGGFMKTVMMEAGNNARYSNVRSMFENAGFRVSVKKDFRSWLWVHFIMNAGMAAVALNVGGYKTMNHSGAHLKDAFLLMREMLPVVKAKGGKVSGAEAIMLALPAGLTGFAMQKFMAKESLARTLMDALEESGHSSYELTSEYPRDVLGDAGKFGVSLPGLEALESVFR